MAITDNVDPTAKPYLERISGLSSQYDHDLETAKPYEYSVLLEDEDIYAEATAAHHSCYYRFSYPDSGQPGLVLNMPKGA
ncbi:hypothetical protein [Paenibacillus sp. YN15]|uniref:hypothetical protein n=1 Tax=Paenibacillus sp. YN15 TaxID=1742774 RepID=UPI000DCC37CE|nr:hypothetical protein [Paenibacillus sp. YN15]RAU92164.1 hypothetical protein DQG13_28000 [Paenibacillus sp. YN15]